MLRIECPHCGLRDELEFAFGGPSHVARPPADAGDAEWCDYLFNRDNPKGVSHERWCHRFGCERWFNIARHTMTHEILAVYEMGEPAPAIGVPVASPPGEDRGSPFPATKARRE